MLKGGEKKEKKKISLTQYKLTYSGEKLKVYILLGIYIIYYKKQSLQ